MHTDLPLDTVPLSFLANHRRSRAYPIYTVTLSSSPPFVSLISLTPLLCAFWLGAILWNRHMVFRFSPHISLR